MNKVWYISTIIALVLFILFMRSLLTSHFPPNTVKSSKQLVFLQRNSYDINKHKNIFGRCCIFVFVLYFKYLVHFYFYNFDSDLSLVFEQQGCMYSRYLTSDVALATPLCFWFNHTVKRAIQLFKQLFEKEVLVSRFRDRSLIIQQLLLHTKLW